MSGMRSEFMVRKFGMRFSYKQQGFLPFNTKSPMLYFGGKMTLFAHKSSYPDPSLLLVTQTQFQYMPNIFPAKTT